MAVKQWLLDADLKGLIASNKPLIKKQPHKEIKMDASGLKCI